jgi:hypothetical protein
MEKKSMIVQNVSGKEIKIPELKKVIPAKRAYYKLPYAIAYKYRKYLKPIQMRDDMPIEMPQDVATKSVTPPVASKVNTSPAGASKGSALERELASLKLAASNNIPEPQLESREAIVIKTNENTVKVENVSGAPVVIDRIEETPNSKMINKNTPTTDIVAPKETPVEEEVAPVVEEEVAPVVTKPAKKVKKKKKSSLKKDGTPRKKPGPKSKK